LREGHFEAGKRGKKRGRTEEKKEKKSEGSDARSPYFSLTK